jgi:hypothetical protein
MQSSASIFVLKGVNRRKMKIQIVLLLALVILPISALAQGKSFSETELTEKGQKAFQTLLSASRFEGVLVGRGLQLSRLVAAYRTLLEEEKRVEALKSLLEKATIAGQLYALCGLYDADYDFFLSAVEKYKVSDQSVDTISGCIGRWKQVREIVFLDNPNTARLGSPTQSVEQWREKAGAGVNEVMIDISGGGYPAGFRGKSSDR